MITIEDARAFARDWVDAWNDKNIDLILSHYADTVTFHSPRIALVLGRNLSQLDGKAALRAYWMKALKQAPDLYFELDTVFASANAVIIAYTNHREQSASECFIFNTDGEIVTSVAAYA